MVSPPPPSVAIFQHLQGMEFTFHNSCFIIDIVSSAVIFWTDLSCWPTCYSNKATLLIGWSHPYTIKLTVARFPCIKWKWIFYFLRNFFPSSITANTFIGLDCIYELHGVCLIRSRNCLPFASTWAHPSLFLFGVFVLLISLFLFCVVLLFTLWLPCCDLRYDDSWKRCSLHLYLQLFVGGAHVLFTLLVVACS